MKEEEHYVQWRENEGRGTTNLYRHTLKIFGVPDSKIKQT